MGSRIEDCPATTGPPLKLTSKPRIDATILTLIASAFLAVACNARFWHGFIDATGHLSLAHLPLHLGCFLLVVLLFNACLTAINFRYVIKPVLMMLFVASSATCYFMSEYGTAIDKNTFTVEKRGKKPQSRVFSRHAEIQTEGDLAKDARVTVYYRDQGGQAIAHRVIVKPGTGSPKGDR